jgi:AMMECR1 domain-containing protein
VPPFVSPLFVTWKKRHNGVGEWRLRGCIGTFSPKELGEGQRTQTAAADSALG